MKVLEITDIVKKDIPLHYRNEFSGNAHFKSPQSNNIVKSLEFTLERSALGQLDISINLLEDIDYPLIPVIKNLKNFILQMEKEGRLI